MTLDMIQYQKEWYESHKKDDAVAYLMQFENVVGDIN